jgi:hypothetical protein
MALQLWFLNVLALAIAVGTAYDIQLSSPELRQFFSTYDKSLPPSEFNGGPVTVHIGMYYKYIDVYREPGRAPKIELQYYNLRLSWIDPRLEFI